MSSRRAVPDLPVAVLEQVTDAVLRPYAPASRTHAENAWAAFWRSKAAAHVDADADLDGLQWWIQCVYRRHMLEALVRAQPVVADKAGNPIAHPLESTVATLTRQIESAADAYLMTPGARARHSAERAAEDEMRELESSARPPRARRSLSSPP